eukprot:TRINITY_DN17804_c0_g1_i1.p1 TRINITY_DN17804_c0_g1~~TRINITY_DN17804_c0_g1_i1.p1  ORF type:complete len:499 (-),score=87.70 TRINITY_DN17804_c0_g1_i1:95-1591(-)
MMNQMEASSNYGSIDSPDLRPDLQSAERPLGETIAPFLSEFVGTYLLVFVIGVCSVAGDPLWNPTAIGAMLMALVYAFGPISGGHLNPSVSVAAGLVGKMPWPKVCAYVMLQMSGGIVAGLACYEVFGKSLGVSPPEHFGFWFAALVELIYTMMLCFVVLNVAMARRSNPEGDQNHYFGLAIGFVIIAGGYAAGGISGALFNPAASIGLGVAGNANASAAGYPWGLAYAGVQLLGAMVAALFFSVCRREDVTKSSDPSFEPSLFSGLSGEFLGTFLLALTVGLNLGMKSSATAWSAAAALMCMVYSLGDVSGGHFNPAVTTAVVLAGRGKCSLSRGLSYWAAQLTGGLAAGLVCAEVQKHGPYKHEEFGRLQPQADFTWLAVFVAELAFTFMLAFVVLAVATTRPPHSISKQNFQFGLAIGSCVMAGGIAIGSISGGVLNPAVAWSIAAAQVVGSSKTFDFMPCLAFSLFELAGGVAAAAMFGLSHNSEYRKPGALLD